MRPFNPTLQDGADPARILNARKLQGGAAGIAFFDVRFTTMKDVPSFLSHRLVVQLPGSGPSSEHLSSQSRATNAAQSKAGKS